MKELPRNWISHSRALPLNENRQIDFSLDKNDHRDEKSSEVDPLRDERFMGRLFKKISMPDEGKIIMLFQWDDADPELPLKVTNHNVFRLDRENKVIWQVQRNENKFVNWESRNFHAKEDNPQCEGYLDPFIAMSEKFFYRKQLPDKGPFHPNFEEAQFSEYKYGRLLWLITRWWAYDLDPETGVATCTGEQVR